MKNNRIISFIKNVFKLFDLVEKVYENIINNKLMIKLICEQLSGVQFYGQELQDMYAYLWFKGKRDGFFIDIGAYDGITISNTYSLEKIGWKGICIEPVPDIYEKLRNNRKCECVNAALSNRRGGGHNKFIQTKGGRSGFTQNMNHKMLSAAKNEGIIAEIDIKTLTFDTLMEKYDSKYIDFMSIDVEGSEIEILKTINFDKYKFGLITIENNQSGKDEEQLIPFMKSKGYKTLLNVGIDVLFIPIDTDVGMYWWREPR